MSTRTKLIILIVLFIALAIALWLVLFRAPRVQQDELFNTNNTTSPTTPSLDNGAQPSQERIVDLRPITADEQALVALTQQITIFVERFGTHSNQSDFSSIRALKTSMTSRAQLFVERFITEFQQQYSYRNGFYGVTTKVVSVDIPEFSQSSQQTVAYVGTRRDIESSIQGVATESINQAVEVRVQKASGTWLVDGIFWK